MLQDNLLKTINVCISSPASTETSFEFFNYERPVFRTTPEVTNISDLAKELPRCVLNCSWNSRCFIPSWAKYRHKWKGCLTFQECIKLISKLECAHLACICQLCPQSKALHGTKLYGSFMCILGSCHFYPWSMSLQGTKLYTSFIFFMLGYVNNIMALYARASHACFNFMS